MKISEKNRKRKRAAGLWRLGTATFLAAVLCVLPAVLADPARAAELDQPGFDLQSGLGVESGSDVQQGSAVLIEKSLSYGYSAAEAEIPVMITNSTEKPMTVKIVQCELTGGSQYFSLPSDPEGTGGLWLEIPAGETGTVCAVRFRAGMSARTQPYTAGLTITLEYEDEGSAPKEDTSSYSLSVTVNRKNIKDCAISGIQKKYYYTGLEIKPEFTISNGSQTLAEGTDYTAVYSSNTNTGTGRVALTGLGNYTGTTEKTFEIDYYDGEVNPQFNGAALSENWYTEDVVISAEGYVISDLPNGTYQNTYTVSAEGDHSLSLYFKQESTGYITDVYGCAVKVDKTAPNMGGLQISNVTDTAASVRVPASDTGSGLLDCYLYWSETERADITAEQVKSDGQTFRFAQAETVPAEKDSAEAQPADAVFELSGLTEGKMYYLYAAVEDVSGHLSGVNAGSFTTKRRASVTEPSGLTAVYGQSLSDVNLPEGWSWVDSSAPVTVANSGYAARFVPADTDSVDYTKTEGYEYDSGSGRISIVRTLAVKVSPAVPVLAWKAGNTQTAVYSGKAAAVTAPEVGLINNEVFQGTVSWSWRKASDGSGSFTAGLPSEPGSYVVRASVEAAGNYSAASADMTLSIDWLKNAPDAGFSDQDGKTLSAGAWCKEAVLTAPEGYDISLSPAAQYGKSVRITTETGKDGAAAVYYLRQAASGGIAQKKVIVYLDRTAPGGSISVGGTTWNRMLPEENSELRISEQKEVTISTEDGQSGVKTVEYTISDKKCKSREEIQKLGGWLIYNPDAKPDIRQSGANYVYVRITDHAGNMTGLSAGKILYDSSSKSSGPSAGGSGSSGTSGTSGSQTGQTSSGTGSGSSKKSGWKGSTAVKTPEKGTAYIHGRESISGWDAIREELEDARPGSTVILDMNGASTVPGNVLSVMKGRDVRLVLNMEEDIVWTIDGRSFTTGVINDTDFTVDMEAQPIPEELIQALAGERGARQISLAYDGEFGFTAVLAIHLEEEYAGLYANLFCYQEQDSVLEYLDSAEVGEDGRTEFSFTHASDYAIVLDEAPFDGTEQETEEENEALILPEREEEKDDSVWTTVLILVVCLIVLAAGIGICVWLVRKYKREESE